jgi:tRNA (guanine-N7-)-methyltransferase
MPLAKCADRCDTARLMTTDDDYGVPIPGEILPPEAWARTAIKKLPPPGPLNWVALFGRTAPIVLDLGCGNGRFTLASALARPQCDHVALDILPVVIRYATRRANQRGLSNVRVAVCGGYEFLDAYVASNSVAEIHLYHPQPFKDEDKSYKRMVTPDLLALVRRCLSPDGQFIVQTDNRPYWNYIRQIAPAFFDFREQRGPWPDAPQGRTRREIYALRKGLAVHRACGTPRNLTADAVAELLRSLPRPQFAAGTTAKKWRYSRRRRS